MKLSFQKFGALEDLLGLNAANPALQEMFGSFEVQEDQGLDWYAELFELGVELSFEGETVNDCVLSTIILFLSGEAAEDASEESEYSVFSARSFEVELPGATKSSVAERCGPPVKVREERPNTVIGLLPGAYDYSTSMGNTVQFEFSGESIYRLILKRGEVGFSAN